jgi:hypothetical protein
MTSMKRFQKAAFLSCLLGFGAVQAMSQCVASSNRSTDPADFVVLQERPVRGKTIPVPSTNSEVDNQSTIHLRFDVNKMACPRSLVEGGPARSAVRVRVEAYSIKGSSRSPIAPVPHYVELLPSPVPAAASSAAGGGGGTEGNAPAPAGTIVYHDKNFNPDEGAAIIPDTDIRLAGTQAGAADFVEIIVTNIQTQQSLDVLLTPRVFGFHFKVSDTVMFVKRLGIGSQEKAAGISDFNFGPSPGVCYNGTYFARKNALVRFLQPGGGITLLFTNWGNPAFDLTTGQFVAGTKSSDIQTALGGQLTFFGNVVQLGYGANLQVDQKRQYFSVGLSFVNLTTKLSGLIAK